MASIADMIQQAAQEAGTSTTSGSTPDGAAPTGGSGIQIERQNVEHVRGQAKSGC